MLKRLLSGVDDWCRGNGDCLLKIVGVEIGPRTGWSRDWLCKMFDFVSGSCLMLMMLM